MTCFRPRKKGRPVLDDLYVVESDDHTGTDATFHMPKHKRVLLFHLQNTFALLAIMLWKQMLPDAPLHLLLATILHKRLFQMHRM